MVGSVFLEFWRRREQRQAGNYALRIESIGPAVRLLIPIQQGSIFESVGLDDDN
jgi:hypothetical protein